MIQIKKIWKCMFSLDSDMLASMYTVKSEVYACIYINSKTKHLNYKNIHFKIFTFAKLFQKSMTDGFSDKAASGQTE